MSGRNVTLDANGLRAYNTFQSSPAQMSGRNPSKPAVAVTVPEFQSSPAQMSGRNTAGIRIHDSAGVFQSSPAQMSGRNRVIDAP